MQIARFSSKYIDEDGDEAHEFYTEKIDGDSRKLARIHTNLKPKVIFYGIFRFSNFQGKERHEIPHFSPDLPVVTLELPAKN